jgi:hypothetical protein
MLFLLLLSLGCTESISWLLLSVLQGLGALFAVAIWADWQRGNLIRD